MRPTWGGGRYEGGAWLPFNWYQIPVTRFLLFATVAVFLAHFFGGQARGPIFMWIPFRTEAWMARPWTLFTYPLLEMPSFWVLLTLYLLYLFGGMLERAWGAVNFLVLVLAFTAIQALAFVGGMYVFRQGVILAGWTLPLTALVTAWAALDPELECSFWGIPVRAKLIAVVWVALAYFQVGIAYQNPWFALCTLAGPAAACFYVRRMPRLNLSAPGRSRPSRYAPDLEDGPRRRPERGTEAERLRGFNPLRRRREQREIERLRRLLGDDDEGDRAIRH